MFNSSIASFVCCLGFVFSVDFPYFLALVVLLIVPILGMAGTGKAGSKEREVYRKINMSEGMQKSSDNFQISKMQININP